MAKPKIFISSTYYDLRNIRMDLERYIKERNFEPILNERGQIAYKSDTRLEDYCYKEIENCDILISIVGGRFGSQAHASGGYSISQKELKTALDKGKQIYIFIDKAVLHEYRTYEQNKDGDFITSMKFLAVDDIKIYHFLDEVFALPLNNQYTGFETSHDIIQYLQEQWASLFQSLLNDAAKQKDIKLMDELKDTAKTLKELVTYLRNEKDKGDMAIAEILFSNHPIFNSIKNALNTRMRLYFTNLNELKDVMSAFGFQFDENPFDIEYFEWQYKSKVIKVSSELFTSEEKLIPMDVNQWKEENVILKILQPKFSLDDDLPF